jgi:hypothetical protein
MRGIGTMGSTRLTWRTTCSCRSTCSFETSRSAAAMRLEQAVEGCRGSAASEDGNRGRNGGRVLAGVLPLRDHAAGRTQSPGIPLRWQSAILKWERCLHTSAALCSKANLGMMVAIGRIRGVGVRSPWAPGDPERAFCALCTLLDLSSSARLTVPGSPRIITRSTPVKSS